ncbi:MAG: response regulator [bacterium]
MCKVMIVDDELSIRETLKNTIDWQDIGITSVEDAENGQDALIKIIEEPVDIIISDINMPIMGGIDLFKKVKEYYPNTRFIIISGYEDFSCAKEAISIGVQAYILKPIDNIELTKDLKELVQDLNNHENMKESNINLFRNILNSSKNISNDEIEKAEVLLNNTINIKKNKKINNNNNLIFTASIWFIKDELNLKIDYKAELYDYIDEIIEDSFGNIILINTFSSDTSYLDIKIYYQHILDSINNKYKSTGFICVGKIVDKFIEISSSYKISHVVKKSILQVGFGKCITIEDVNTTIVDFTNEINNINKLIFESVDETVIDNIMKYIQEVVDRYDKNLQCIYDFAIKILILCDDLKSGFKNKDELLINTLNLEEENLWILGEAVIKVIGFTNIEDIKKYLRSKILNILKHMDIKTNKLSPVIKRVIKHINENYSEDISLKNLAMEYNMNTSYLGQLFAKEVGMQFSEYINKVRSTIAKELILKTSKKIHDIAREVGYIDKSHFYRNFKKYYGVTPVTLRELQR